MRKEGGGEERRSREEKGIYSVHVSIDKRRGNPIIETIR
jgi:hypothetical protein